MSNPQTTKLRHMAVSDLIKEIEKRYETKLTLRERTVATVAKRILEGTDPYGD